jgi:hypothetical protein
MRGFRSEYRLPEHLFFPALSMRDIDGPGVWVSCNIGKEKQCVAEIYNLFQEVRLVVLVLPTSTNKHMPPDWRRTLAIASRSGPHSLDN